MTRPALARLPGVALLALLLPMLLAGCEEGFGPAAVAPGTARLSLPVAAPQTSVESCEIGSVSTPACTVVTFIACIERRDRALCEAAGQQNIGFADTPRPERIDYTVERVEERGPGAADVFVSQRMCPVGETAGEEAGRSPCRDERLFEIVYFTQRSGAGWRVDDWMDAEHANREPAD